MSKRKQLLDLFTDKISKIEANLEELQDLSDEISKLYNTNSFKEQEKLSAEKLDNLFLAITHKTASQIGFYRFDIELLTKYIKFREKFREFTDEELAIIIDKDLSAKSKQILVQRFASVGELLNRINLLKKEWNKVFNNVEYIKIKRKFCL